MTDQRTQLRLRTGRFIYLRELRQWGVYEGLLEGLPTTAMNQRSIEGIVAEYRGKPNGSDPFLIQPSEEPIEWGHDRPYPFGNPAALPDIACVARFTCLEPARDPRKEFSGLRVIWFQKEFAFPIDPDVLDRLQALDWERHAVDMDY